MRVIRERHGSWHIYETSTEPWALITAFKDKEAAEAFVNVGRMKGLVDVKIGSWVKETLQEPYRCVICGTPWDAGSEAALRSVTLIVLSDTGKYGAMDEVPRFEAKCLSHIPTRFDREPPV